MERDDIFQFSMDNALEMIIVFNKNGTIIYANKSAEQKLEYGDELYKTNIRDIFPSMDSLEDNYLERVHEFDKTVRDMMAYRKNRTCFPVKTKILIHKDKYVCVASDASTESFLEKRVQQVAVEAEEAQKVKSEFVANVTHELRTPVNGILGNTQELISREEDTAKLKLLRMVERGCRDMNAIINNILDFSKLEAGKFVLEPRQFDFRNMIEYVKGNHSNRIIEKGLSFSVNISPEIPESIVADELRIVQVLNNLISNAYKFTAVGNIHVEVVKTAQTGNRIELFFMVMDSGVGIAKADQDKLFKSFSQVDASISRKYGGTGLGLNICKQLVELMGGRIHVESEIGKGSTFSFDIWAELPTEGGMKNSEVPSERENTEPTMYTKEDLLKHKIERLTENPVSEKIWVYGEAENKEELEKRMSKLILSVEMENWEKAEMFAETVKQLLEGAPREMKSAALRLKMAVQKGDYDKTVSAYETLQEMI